MWSGYAVRVFCTVYKYWSIFLIFFKRINYDYSFGTRYGLEIAMTHSNKYIVSCIELDSQLSSELY